MTKRRKFYAAGRTAVRGPATQENNSTLSVKTNMQPPHALATVPLGIYPRDGTECLHTDTRAQQPSHRMCPHDGRYAPRSAAEPSEGVSYYPDESPENDANGRRLLPAQTHVCNSLEVTKHGSGEPLAAGRD